MNSTSFGKAGSRIKNYEYSRTILAKFQVVFKNQVKMPYVYTTQKKSWTLCYVPGCLMVEISSFVLNYKKSIPKNNIPATW